jgi:hypothetical protein
MLSNQFASSWHKGYLDNGSRFSNGVTGESSLEIKEKKGRWHADAAVWHDEGGEAMDTRAQADYRTPYRAKKAAEGFEQRLTAGKSLPKRVDTYTRPM